MAEAPPAPKDDERPELLGRADWLRAGGDQSLEADSLLAPLAALIERPAVTCSPATPLGNALELMQREKVGSIVVTEGGSPLGIYTTRDLLRATAAGRFDPRVPIREVMTPDPIGLTADASVSEAASLMSRHGIRHLAVTCEGRIAGVVSESRLFAFHRGSTRHVGRSIELAQDLEGLQHAASSIRRLARHLVAQGMAAEPLTQLISTLNDRLTVRIIDLQRARHAMPGIGWCWIALGSEGRHEQTVSTDQDNGLVFEGPEGAREALLALARDVNGDLDACGYPLCRGGIMAGNPAWCLSATEWRERFSSWVRNPSPQALLNAAVFFDFRPLAGEPRLAQELRTWLAGLVRGDARFLKTLAAAALESRPPLGIFGEVVRNGATGSVDLKAQGTRIFVDAARIFALACGVTGTSTAARLRGASGVSSIPAPEVEASLTAFHYLLTLRLRRQQNVKVGAAANEMDPRTLNDVEQRILKEALNAARRLQRRLALDYQL